MPEAQDEEEEAEVERASGSSGEHECERVRVSGQWQRAQAPSTVDDARAGRRGDGTERCDGG